MQFKIHIEKKSYLLGSIGNYFRFIISYDINLIVVNSWRRYDFFLIYFLDMRKLVNIAYYYHSNCQKFSDKLLKALRITNEEIKLTCRTSTVKAIKNTTLHLKSNQHSNILLQLFFSLLHHYSFLKLCISAVKTRISYFRFQAF